MSKRKKVNPLMSDAFIFWLLNLGYKSVISQDGVMFYHSVFNSNFPRNVMILANGKLNKPASRLFKEFLTYDPFNEVA